MNRCCDFDRSSIAVAEKSYRTDHSSLVAGKLAGSVAIACHCKHHDKMVLLAEAEVGALQMVLVRKERETAWDS